jgi:hypothetical protein
VAKAVKAEDIEEVKELEDSFKGRRNWNTTTSSKQPEMKLYPHRIERDRQAVTYDTVKDHIVQYIQKTYRNGQDAAVSIRNLEVKDLTPHESSRCTAAVTDPAENLKQQAGMDILYQAKLERYLDRKDTLEQNLTKAYALIFSTYCNKTMQNWIEEYPEFESVICDDPIELLNKIKVLMHDPIRAKYPFTSLTKAISRMLNFKQSENEGLLDYVKRFKELRDMMKSHMGTNILNKFVENTLEYWDESNATLKQEIKDRVFGKWIAYLLIRNSDQAKYGSLSNGFVSQFSMQNNQYPKTCTTATDILNNHRFDNRGDLNKKKWSNKTKKDEDENALSKTTSKTTQQAKQRNQVLRKAAKIKYAIAAERKDIWVLSALTRTQSRKKIGIFEKPHSTIWKPIRLTFTKMINRMVTMKVQLVKV